MNYPTEFMHYLQQKGYSQSTIKGYCFNVFTFFKRTQLEEIRVTKADVLNYLAYLKNKRQQQNHSRRCHLQPLNLYFTFLQQQNIITKNPCSLLKLRGVKRKTLHKTFTAEQLTQIFDNYYTHFVQNHDESKIQHHNRLFAKLSKQRNAAMLSILLHQGTTTKEIDLIELQDIDLIKATIKIRGARRSNSRTIALKAEQIGILMYYLQNVRPQLIERSAIENNKLFLPLPQKKNQATITDNLMNTFRDLTKQVQQIEPSFTNFKQTRASAITLWLKTVGLRKTQYLAGHRNINSTENYLPNNIEELSNDIKKLHPYQ